MIDLSASADPLGACHNPASHLNVAAGFDFYKYIQMLLTYIKLHAKLYLEARRACMAR